jgi:hypothetical protein
MDLHHNTAACPVDGRHEPNPEFVQQACGDAEVAAGAPSKQAPPMQAPPHASPLRPVAAAEDRRLPLRPMPSVAPTFGDSLPEKTPQSTPSSTILEYSMLRSNSREDFGEKAAKLLEDISEFTGLRNTSNKSLPVDFKIMLQVVEFMGQQASVLHELKRNIEDMKDELGESIFAIKHGLDDTHVLLHDRLNGRIAKVGEHIASHLDSHSDALHDKLNAMQGDHKQLVEHVNENTALLGAHT